MRSDPMRVKVCGLCRHEDVAAAIAAGADDVGFVSFEPSPRHLSPLQIIALADSLVDRGVRGVLVTVDADPDVSARLVDDARLGAVQLCGDEDPFDWRGEYPFAILRRVPVREGAESEIERWGDVADLFVLDHPVSAGGSGRSVDRALAAEFAARGPCLLAGGLGAESLEAGLDGRLVDRLVGVDASSRLEKSRGVKDHLAIARFVEAAHSLRPGPRGAERA